MAPVILLTGRPGIGKSTLIGKLVEALADKTAGFYTREIRAGQTRTGFEIVTLEGQTAILATQKQDVRFARQAQLGRYKVNLDALETVAVPSLLKAKTAGQIVIVDEIGPMEIFSQKFCEVILELLNDSAIAMLGTIVERPYRFADDVKKHPRVEVRAVTLDNREDRSSEIQTYIR